MSSQPSQNGAFAGAGPFRIGPDLPRWRDARPRNPGRDEVEECRRISGNGPVARMVEEIEGYGAGSVEELGALRDLELWGPSPFELED